MPPCAGRRRLASHEEADRCLYSSIFDSGLMAVVDGTQVNR
jgi:hypothetical protein